MKLISLPLFCCILLLTTGIIMRVPHAQAENTFEPIPEIAKITVKGSGFLGGDRDMVTQIFKPGGEGPFPVLIFSHGRSGEAEERAKLKYPIPLGHVQYWVKKGYAVVAPIRPGYGETGGVDRESASVHYDASGNCDITGKADHAHTVNSAQSVMLSAVDWVRSQPWARHDRIILEGISVGGITTVALCAINPPGVVGCINFSGGSGGSPKSGGKVCNPEVINELMHEWGKTTKIPSIWLYAANDQFWGPDNPQQWYKSFSAGGSATIFIGTDAVPNEYGHQLLRKGGKMWSLPLNDWLKKNGLDASEKR